MVVCVVAFVAVVAVVQGEDAAAPVAPAAPATPVAPMKELHLKGVVHVGTNATGQVTVRIMMTNGRGPRVALDEKGKELANLNGKAVMVKGTRDTAGMLRVSEIKEVAAEAKGAAAAVKDAAAGLKDAAAGVKDAATEAVKPVETPAPATPK